MTDSLSFTRKEFPFLRRKIDGKGIIYLDSASTAPKPQCVIDAVAQVYQETTANVHRGIHTIADEATAAYENARTEIASFERLAVGNYFHPQCHGGHQYHR